MQSITVPSVLSPKPRIIATTATCTLAGWPSRHTRLQTHWLQVIYKTLLGKVPPYLSSLVTIAAHACSKRSSRCISLVTPKTNSSFCHLSFKFSAANDCNELQKSLKLETLISLTSFKHQLSEQLTYYCTCTQPIYNLSQTATSSPTVFIYFVPLHPSISISTLHILPLEIYHSSVLLAILYFLCHHGRLAFTSLISPHLLTSYIDLFILYY